jgi:outer membrane protein TolC
MKQYILTIITMVTVAGLHAQPLSLSLQDCRRMALEYNEKIKTADNAVNKAKLDRQIAFAQYLPKVDGSFTLLHMQNQDLLEIGNVLGVSLQTLGTFLAGVNITQPLYVGGQITAANRLARIGQTVHDVVHPAALTGQRQHPVSPVCPQSCSQ